MDNTKKQLAKLEKFLELITEDHVMPEELEKIIEFVLKIISDTKDSLRQIDQENKDELSDKIVSVQQLASAIEEKCRQMIAKHEGKMTKEMDVLTEQLFLQVKTLRDSIPSQSEMSSIESRLIVLEKPEPEAPYKARNELEAIDNESEKLKMEAIQNLPSELKKIWEELKKNSKGRASLGGFNYKSMDFHIIDDETPVGTINSSNTIFTIANTPSPSSSLKVYLNGARQRITEDFSFSGTTITFTIAPPTGSVLLVDYRI